MAPVVMGCTHPFPPVEGMMMAIYIEPVREEFFDCRFPALHLSRKQNRSKRENGAPGYRGCGLDIRWC